MFTVEDFFSELLARMELGRVSRNKNLYAYSDVKKTAPIHYIVFLALQDCWNWLKAKRNDPSWLTMEITPAEVRFIRHHVVQLLGERMRAAQAEIDKEQAEINKGTDKKEFIGQLHMYQAGGALDLFILNFVYVCDHHNIAYRKKFKLHFPLP